MLTILIPMAGSGKRFVEAGYTEPKPLIPVGGMPMVQRVVESLTQDLCSIDYQLHFVVRDRQVYQALSAFYHAGFTILTWPTDGAACTCLAAREVINNDDSLLIANCDQLVPPESVRALIGDSGDGAILTMKGDGSTKWSYAQVEDGKVIEVVEKQPISDRATCGLYFWRRGRDFVKSAERMIEHEDRTNNEFYVAPAFNYFDGVVTEVRVEDYGDGKFVGLGTPEDLKSYLGQ